MNAEEVTVGSVLAREGIFGTSVGFMVALLAATVDLRVVEVEIVILVLSVLAEDVAEIAGAENVEEFSSTEEVVSEETEDIDVDGTELLLLLAVDSLVVGGLIVFKELFDVLATSAGGGVVIEFLGLVTKVEFAVPLPCVLTEEVVMVIASAGLVELAAIDVLRTGKAAVVLTGSGEV
ncbi:hypothetical protein QR680_017921 [Steinernema hermaphroditum]|uniref:Uncharacterized protein n=1 Tax=Steinernema hermaphroditum TaxID=289476 RepID=A0AA39LQ94_9BILA|nr:hypothetical protein QR680_017921 [Steinernema hermaphroditum]